MTNIGFDRRQIQRILFAGEANGVTAGASATGTADAVNVIFAVVRQIVVKDVGHGRNVQTTSGNIGRDQDIEVAAGKFFENTQTFFLRHVAGQQTYAMAVGGEMPPDIFTTMLGIGEDDGAIGPLFFQQRLQQAHFSSLDG